MLDIFGATLTALVTASFATTFVQGCKGAQCLGTHCAVSVMFENQILQ